MRESYLDTPLWDSSLSEKKRLDYLLEALTLEEKFQCLGTGCPGIQRLGIPKFGVGGEGAHGIQARNDQEYDTGEPVPTTILPNPIGMSATWDEELIKEAGAMVGKEARGLYHAGKHGSLCLWAPTVDMERDPRWGRTEEGYGEDPFLTGKMAGAYVEGIQGEDSYYLRCGATLKHFYANNVEEGRTYTSSSVDLRNKHEYYLEPFRRLAQEHHAEGMMTAYNEVNGIPCMLLKDDIERMKEWGIGHVVCDGGDVSQTVDFHKYFSRHSETIAAGLDAKIDCFTDNMELVEQAAREAYEHGMITREQIDGALRNYFRVMLRLGLFDKEGRNPYGKIGMETVGTPENHALVRKMTAESVVLLKNENILPLSLSGFQENQEKLAVIGPLSDVWFKDWYSGVPPYFVTPAQGIRNVLPENVMEEEGVSLVKIRLQTNTDRYLGILEDGKSIGLVNENRAEVFRIDFWGDDKITLRALSNGLLLTTQDDAGKGQTGEVAAMKEEAFGWFVREIFYLVNGELLTWDKQKLAIDADGKLRKRELIENQMLQADLQAENRKGDLIKKKDDSTKVEKKSVLNAGSENSMDIELIVIKDGIQTAVESARQADKVLLFLGPNPMINCKEEIDRTNLELPAYQEEMLRRICAVNKKVVLILVSSIPFNISFAKENVSGIMLCATGSMELGNGLADVIFGKESPAGRLSMTWYSSVDDLPPINDYDIIENERTYQYYNGKVLYPFGYGLTYSTIQYQDMKISLKDYTKLRVELSVHNIGNTRTDEVVQIYFHKINSVVKRARRKLIAFRRIKNMEAGEKREVVFEVPLNELKYFDVISEEMLLEPGEYEIMAGQSCEKILQKARISLEGTERPVREGQRINKAECFDRAFHHVLRRGHLGYTAVCTKNGTDTLELYYEKMRLEKSSPRIILDFWKEHPCKIWIEANDKLIGTYELGNPAGEEAQQLEAGQASGDGAFEAHQNWLTRRREIGFAELSVPVENVPVQKEFTLAIKWQGKGKLCTYHFE